MQNDRERILVAVAGAPKVAELERLRPVDESLVRSRTGRASSATAIPASATPGSYQPKYACSPSLGRNVP